MPKVVGIFLIDHFFKKRYNSQHYQHYKSIAKNKYEQYHSKNKAIYL